MTGTPTDASTRALLERLAPPVDRSNRPRPVVAALKVALGYALLGGLWIVLTDQLVVWLLGDGAATLTAQTAKGLLFIALSGAFVFWLALRAVRETARGLAFDRTQLSHHVLESILGSLGEAVFIVDPSTRTILHCNDAAESMFGYARDELVGRNTVQLHVDRETYLEFARRSQACLERGEVYRGEYRMRTRDGEVFETENTVSPLREELGWSGGVVSVVRDVSERAQLEHQVRQAQKMESVGRLAGGVAHDFNNLLSVVLASSEIALESLPRESAAREHLLEIRQAGERGANLTRQLLAFARKQEISPVRLDLHAAVEGMARMLQRLIPEDIGLELRAQASGPLPVRMDPGQIDQILANLVINAGAAIGEVPGRIVVETDTEELDAAFCAQHGGCRPGPHAVLRVSDDGVGMDAATRAQLFEPFFTTKAQGRGTGLGMATVYGIVKQNEGAIAVESEPGEGTRISIWLPLDQSGEPLADTTGHAPADDPSGSARRAPDGSTILLVEDEPALLELLARVLEREGHRVARAGCADEALTKAAELGEPVQLLITDIVLPNRTGRELFERLAEQQPGLRCLFMSGYTADVIAHRGVVEDDVQLLTKPFSTERLVEKVRELLAEG